MEADKDFHKALSVGTKKTEFDMVDVEMANDATTKEQSIPKRQSRRRVYERKLTIDNLSPQVWCMEPRILIDAQAKKRHFSTERPAELTNLSPQVWSEFQDNLLSTWRFSRNEALKTFALVFSFILILVILNALIGEAFILIILLVSAVASGFL